jgi:crotonobetainyl-CoA:carnitine CoA-transferase CaiB-like acyl-CoA transferase
VTESTPSPTATPPGPLSGVRVVDLSSVVMGPFATQILGDLGADVICVEDARGDTNRVMGPTAAPGLSGVALNLLRNKRNVCLDLKHAHGRDAFLRLVATADVVVTNLRPGPLARLGLTYEQLVAVRPGLVMCQAHGWPSDSALADSPAYDDIIQAGCGIAAAFELQTGMPTIAPTLVADKVAGLTIVYGVIAALFHRERTGEGQFLEVPMIEAMTAFTLVEHGCAAIPEPKLGRAGYPRVLSPHRRPFRSSDGWVSVLPYSAANYDAIFAAGGREDLVGDERVRTTRLRLANADSLYAALTPIIATRPTADWLAFCRAHDIPAGPVSTLDDLVDELPLEHHPHAGDYRRIPTAVRFSATPSMLRRHAPQHGEHGREVLAGIGVADEELDAWEASGALRRPN